ncbi:hypothetical protein BW685_20255 [Burkholderia ubonensis]|uniref:Uncharacterized protein n=1 Tax=Burkholderia ubonensis TaxID=101571 RepID=A0A1R1J8G7_9BURK|nr:hypothetical protein BW685_20255 [Burkholderia ubonensis]
MSEYLVSFGMVENPSDDEYRLAKDIVLLDHRSLRLLGQSSKERAEVQDLIINVVTIFHQRAPDVARGLLDRAEAIFLQHMQAKNRLRYMYGVVLGCVLMSFFGASLNLAPGITESLLPRKQLPALLLFAFMGTIASLMLRISSIDLRDQTSVPLILISGAARPITAAIFALVLYLLVAAKFIEIHIGPLDEMARQNLFMLVSFMCGFSERFAGDILSRFGGELGRIEFPGAASNHVPPNRSSVS